MKLDSSSFGFGFRPIFTKKTDNKLVLAAVNPKMSTDSRQVQLRPLAYLDTDTCPNLIFFNDAKPGGICRSQFYLECFSMQKPSNSNSKLSYSRIGQDLKAAMNKDNKCSDCLFWHARIYFSGMTSCHAIANHHPSLLRWSSRDSTIAGFCDRQLLRATGVRNCRQDRSTHAAKIAELPATTRPPQLLTADSTETARMAHSQQLASDSMSTIHLSTHHVAKSLHRIFVTTRRCRDHPNPK